ncbi:low-temperature-induced 65 kDa protein-like isoform X2 [Nymphaea colorata]|uniref:low-temperature-induced 65 kDa protein-like isoform X2 n=1 Tax=Nymphaea colorata TaxID=210225 RepID=UPI00129E1766|nr:low-temperature-induced 65 kDa protein-like isoform X2 [Nymphaea colorata]
MAHFTDAKYVPIGQSSLPREDSPRGHYSTPPGVSPRKGHHHGHEDGNDGGKKSVMAKVKDKAKKWKNTLVRKKHGTNRPHKNDGIAHGLAGLVEEEDDDEEDNAAAMYEPEMAARGPHTEPAIIHKKDLELNGPSPEQVMNPKNGAELKHQEAIKEPIEKQALGPHSLKHEGDPEQDTHEVQYDKGVSVKEYLIQKLEPGEGDKALSEVITDAITPNKGAPVEGEKTVVEMVKEVVSSFLGTEEPSIPVSTKPEYVKTGSGN